MCVCWKKLKDQGTTTCKERPGLPFTFYPLPECPGAPVCLGLLKTVHGIIGFPDGSSGKPACLHRAGPFFPLYCSFTDLLSLIFLNNYLGCTGLSLLCVGFL